LIKISIDQIKFANRNSLWRARGRTRRKSGRYQKWL